ncbi:hypothetical protein Tco_0046612 [Tanacetum coccineum]
MADKEAKSIMRKVMKGEFEKLETLKINDVLLTCDTSLEFFHAEFYRLRRMDDDLFTYEVKIANTPSDFNRGDDSGQQMSHEANDDMGYDPSDSEFTEWLASKNFNYKTMDHYTKKALWIYLIRGDDEVELTDEKSSYNEDEVAEVFRIDTNLFDFETPMCKAFKEFNYLLQIDPDLLTNDIEGFKTYDEYKDDWIYEWNKDVSWVDEKPWTDIGVWTEPTPVMHCCKPFNYKTGCSEWPTYRWKDDGYYNGGNLPGAYIVGNSLYYQDYEWYEALQDSKLKDKPLTNKAIMEELINEDDDDEEELCSNETHELPVCNMRKFEMIRSSFADDEEYVAIKEDEYDDLTSTSKDACRACQEIFRMMDEGWMDLAEREEIDKLVEVSTSLEVLES